MSPTLLCPNKACHWPLKSRSKPEVMGAAWLRDSVSSVFCNYCLLGPSSTSLWLMTESVCDSLQSGLMAGGRAVLEQRGIPGNRGSPAVSWIQIALSTLKSILSSLGMFILVIFPNRQPTLINQLLTVNDKIILN